MCEALKKYSWLRSALLPMMCSVGVVTLVGMPQALAAATPAGAAATEPEMRRAVEEDWALQERRWKRAPESDEALAAALGRTEAVFKDCRERPAAGKLATGEGSRKNGDEDVPAPKRRVGEVAVGENELAELRRRHAQVGTLDDAKRLALYLDTRWFARDLVMRDPEVTGQPLLFMTRNRFVCQMLHEYMGYFCDYGDVSGGGVYRLERPGYSLEARELAGRQLPKGNFTTLALSHDAKTVYFAFAERSGEKPDFNSPERKSFHLFAMGPDGANLRQLTQGVEDDFDPCPLPDGGVAFMSSRRGGFARCNNAWEPCASYTLHRMDADGGNVRRLSVHETSEWHPSVLNDGRLVYIRWDYVDRSAANFHGLWTSNPDGTGLASIFGNYTMRINACYQPRAIPGSEKLVFLAGAHHADVGGSLVMLEPQRARYDTRSGEDVLESVEVLTPEVCFPESAGWPKSYFHSPWPLSETAMLVSFSFDPLPGMSSGEKNDTRTGLYYFDRYGNLELLYRNAAISSMYPIPLRPRTAPPQIASGLDPDLGGEGEFLLADVRRSLFPMPAGRAIRELRVFQLLPKFGVHTANQPRIGHANAENARMFLGTVPVEADGSAYFRAPAGKPLYFQAVDGQGRAVQSMRSATYLQPGERRGCIGCHEAPGSVAASQPTQAMRREPSRITPGPEGSQPFSFPLLVQPVLERHCVACHDGQEGPGKSKLALTAAPTKTFSRAYDNLKPYLRWYEWGDQSISQIATHPGEIGADASGLSRVLEDKDHAGKLQWTDAERRRLYLWLDGNVPFYGTYDADEQLAQREGKAVPVSVFQ